MPETSNDIIVRLRQSHPRSWFINASNGVLTHAKVSNIEKGRKTTPAEDEAIRALPGAVMEPTEWYSAPETATYVTLDPMAQTPQEQPSLEDIEVTPALPVVSVETALALSTGTASMDDAPSLQELFDRYVETTTPPIPEISDVTGNHWSDNVNTSSLPPHPEFPTTISVVGGFTTQDEPSAKLTLSPTQLSALDGVSRKSNSELATFADCRRRWWFIYSRKLQPRKRENPVGVKHVGSRVHRALERYYVADITRRVDPRDALERVIVEDWTALTDAYSADGVPPELEVLFKKQNDLERAMVEGYVEWLTETGADSDLQVIAPEAYIEMDLHLPSTPYGERPLVKLVGRLDVRVRRGHNGQPMFMDHKTVGDLSTPARTLSLDEQMLMYMLLESNQQVDVTIGGALYNMLRRVKRTGSAKPPFFQRIEVHHSIVELDSFLMRTIGKVNDIVDVERQLTQGGNPLTLVYPRPTRDCSWKCQFLQVCNMVDDGSRLEDALSQLYETGDPYEYYQTNIEEDNIT
jgi:hypothetical protein